MGFWATEIYLHTNKLNEIAEALVKLFARDGYAPCRRPPKDVYLARCRRRTYDHFTNEPLWAVTLLQTGRAWSFLQTNPFYILCDRAAGAQRPRLAELAKFLGTECFELNVYDGVEMLLLECSPDGRFAISGTPYNGYDNIDPNDGTIPFFQEKIPDDHSEASFSLLKHSRVFNSILDNSPLDIPSNFASNLMGVEPDRWPVFLDAKLPFSDFEPSEKLPPGTGQWRELYFARQS